MSKDSNTQQRATRRLSLIHSDAADDLIGVDLGGRRITKKKKKERTNSCVRGYTISILNDNS